ncbi:MAG TPA: hypothetical protein VF913_18810 [Xanthobacteraceae bacterium]
MAKSTLKPTSVPEEVIDELAASLKIDTAQALDLVMFLQNELRAASTKRRQMR